MHYGIGIDTGGTYTDAVIYDFLTGSVISKSKSLTTKEDLSVGIGNALDMLPYDLMQKAEILSLSTTLATNACVENKGGRAKLILIGSDRKSLEWSGAKEKYGLEYENILCLENYCSMDGRVVNHPDWDAVIDSNFDWFSDAHALSVSATYATQNGAVCEKVALQEVKKHYDIPFVMACELASELNTLERGVTAQLNAKLLPVIEEFMSAVTDAVNVRNLSPKTMVVRSDGSLMQASHALKHPVKTILSGPAASIVGGCSLADRRESLIIDMGGTTTDISIVTNGNPVMTETIKVGSFLTQVKGVFIDTFGLGGDSRLVAEAGKLTLSPRRVLPICIAAKTYPQIKDYLLHLLENYTENNLAQHEFIYLVKKPIDLHRYYSNEIELIENLEKHKILPIEKADPYGRVCARLENEGVVMRCGITPTDVMHIKGDFTLHDVEASKLAARYFMQKLDFPDDEDGLTRFCDTVYDAVCLKLYTNIVRVLLCYSYPKVFSNGIPSELINIIQKSWYDKNSDIPAFMDLKFTTVASLVGIGAPTHIFLKPVADALDTLCVIPEHAEVANAVGAIIADISATAGVEITPNYTDGYMDGYVVHSVDSEAEFIEDLEEAVEFGKSLAKKLAIAKARERGALGELSLTEMVNTEEGFSKDGGKVELGTKISVCATGRIEV